MYETQQVWDSEEEMPRYLSSMRVQINSYTKISENPIVLQMRTGDACFKLKRSKTHAG